MKGNNMSSRAHEKIDQYRNFGRTGMVVYVKNGHIDSAIKTLTKKMKKEGVIEDMRKHEFYRSPSIKRKLKHKAALIRKRMDESKNSW